MIGRKLEALQAAVDPLYRLVMLGFMVLELVLLGWLVALEVMHR